MLKRYLALVAPSQAIMEIEAKENISNSDPVFIQLLRSYGTLTLTFIFYIQH